MDVSELISMMLSDSESNNIDLDLSWKIIPPASSPNRARIHQG